MNPTNKKFISMFILLISLFIFVFFTQNIYSTYIDQKETNDKLSVEYKNKMKLNSDLNNLKNNKTDKNFNTEVRKYNQSYSENKMIELFYNFAENHSKNGQISIKSITFTKPKENEIGLKEAKINLNIRILNFGRTNNKKTVKDLLNFIINNNDYKFYIHSFKLPKKIDKPFNIQIPIKFFYQDFKKINNK